MQKQQAGTVRGKLHESLHRALNSQPMGWVGSHLGVHVRDQLAHPHALAVVTKSRSM
jgi:hypothetical protein